MRRIFSLNVKSYGHRVVGGQPGLSLMVPFTADAAWGLMTCQRNSWLTLKEQVKVCGM